jgi:SAM-dependent methyltransferase
LTKSDPTAAAFGAGCAQAIWLDNDRIPLGLERPIRFSIGMAAQARSNLRSQASFHQFAVTDAQAIPFPDGCFDIAIANHMLYHLPNMGKALSEIQRVLKPDGRFYASTIGQRHLQELSDLVYGFDHQLAAWGYIPADSFTLENGSTVLGNYFTEVSLHRYSDSLIVTEASPLIDYILSGRIELDADLKSKLVKFVELALFENSGQFLITKDSGVFESRGISHSSWQCGCPA